MAGGEDGGGGAGEPGGADADGSLLVAVGGGGLGWRSEEGRCGVRRVWGGEDTVCQFEIGHVRGEGTHDAVGGGEVGRGADGHAPVGRFEAVESAVCGWDADGAATVGAEGDGDQSCGYGVGGAAGGTTGVVTGVVRVERSTAVGVVVRSICDPVSLS